MMKRLYSLSLAAALMVTLIVATAASHAHLGSGSSKSAPPTEIKIDNFSFAPVKVTVPAGSTVKWTNRDDIPHTVVSEDTVTFKSQVLDTDQEFAHTFRKAGTYRYFCSVHPRMTAEVVVTE
jgi:plastocyanin